MPVNTPSSSTDVHGILAGLSAEIMHSFESRRSVLSFDEFFEIFRAHPRRYTRSVAQYLVDMFDHYGTEEIETPFGPQRRFKLFDMPFAKGRDRLVGNEATQNAVYRLLSNFVRQQRVPRLVLLHGPNGSAKTSFIQCIMRGLEHYSHLEEGALYRFNWVFPAERISRAAIGFDYEKDVSKARRVDSFAHLEEHEVDAKLIEELKDNPLFCIPKPQRQRLLLRLFGSKARRNHAQGEHESESAPGEHAEDDSFVLSDYIFEGDLSHKSRLVFDALLASYNGDFASVLKHVQVVRFYISRRYRSGAVTVEPQLRVDAGSRQVTADRSLSALPTALQNQTLFEPFGDLVDANRGIVEFNDMLKRHPDLNKYLLATVEKGTVAVDHAILHIDAFLIGSANEQFLEAFKTQPEYASFKGRLDLLRMPYLLDYRTEREIYDQMLASTDVGKHIAPHSTVVAALWAVLTRLTRPQAPRYPASIRDVMSSLTPLDKAMLYAKGKAPDEASADQVRVLRGQLNELAEEGHEAAAYEGLFGVSPREMRNVLLRALQHPAYPCLSPLAVFDELREIVRDKSVHPFLRLKPDGKYHDPSSLIDAAFEHYLDLVDSEVRDSLGLIDRDRYEEYFARYVSHVSQLLKGESVYNPVTRASEAPSEDFMNEVEAALGVTGERTDFRRDIISAVGSFRIEQPDAKLVYSTIFPELFIALEESYFEKRREQVERIERNLLRYVHEEREELTSAEIIQVETTLANMAKRYGYCSACAQEAIAALLRERYGQKTEAS